jgi:histidinol-phosphate aminotransferase
VAPALRSFPERKVPEYGDLAYVRLRAVLGERFGVDPRRILPGAGADELIRLVTTAAVGAGDSVVIPTPTFAMFAVEAHLAGARVVALPRRDLVCRQAPDEIRDAAEREAARLVWLCTPNNPTGDVTPLDEIRAVATGLPALVVVDEVYLEFAEEEAGLAPNSTSAVTLQDELPNLLVLRSLSKAYAMASARVGYLVVPDGLADRFDAIRLPLSVGAASEAIALGVLSDEEAARERRGRIIEARERLAAVLRATGAEVLASTTNFVPFRPADRDAAEVDEALLARGVALRRYDAGPMAGWLRATARLDGEEERLLAALKEVLA